MSGRRPDQHLGPVVTGGEREPLRIGEAGRVARVEASTRVEGAGAASDEDVHVAIVGDVDATTRLQACAPQDRIALVDRDGARVLRAGRDRDE